MRYYKSLLLIICSLLCVGIIGCSYGYYDDEDDDVKVKNKIEGNEILSLEVLDKITLENAKVRIILNEDGSIHEYANKESNLYLLKDASNALPIRVNKKNGGYTTYDSYSFQILENSAMNKKISYIYKIGEVSVKTTITLSKDGDEVVFNLKLLNHQKSDPILDIEYPILDGIKSLNNNGTDYFACPYATGYLFKNPVEAFNSDSGMGFGRSNSLYPSGWYYTMQFSTYYSEGVGGFYWQTKDSGDTIKSLSFLGTGEELKLSVYHCLDDLSSGDKEFNYDFVIANMTKGNWYEAANKYREWAETQPWTKKGKLINRDDFDKTLYEKTSLVNFGYRASEATWSDMISIYDQIASRIDNNIFNISIYNQKKYYDLVREYGHEYVCFEFNSITNISEYHSNKMIYSDGREAIYDLNGATWYYQCPYNQNWLNYRMQVDDGYLNTYNVDAFYFDVAFTAVHPIQCYDENHNHGTRINMLSQFNEQLKNADKQSNEAGIYSVGVEMITEQVLPYVDFYQARANGGLLGWMEHDAIKPYIEAGYAEKIPLFTYVYHEYGALRLDGYLTPEEQLSDAYYNIAAYTVLNGGITEFNFEFYPTNKLPSSSKINVEMIDYVNTLGNVRSGFGKDYLVYGKMIASPSVGAGKITYEFNNPNIAPGNGGYPLTGETIVDKVIVSAYENNGKIAIFLANTTNEDINISFILHALRDYGIKDGIINLISSSNENYKLCSFNNGDAKVKLNLKAREIYMLEIEK